MPPSRPTLPLTWGGGLDRGTGIAAVQPSNFLDLRNVMLLDGTAQARKGMARTDSYVLGGTGPFTFMTGLAALRSKRQGLVLVFETTTGAMWWFNTDALGSALASGLWVTVGAGTALFRIHMVEVYRKCFVAHELELAAARQKTRYYDVDAGTVTDLMADLDGLGAAQVYFRGVARHLNYLLGWGFGSNTDVDRPEVVRASLPGLPTSFQKEHYWLVGARGDPVLNVVSLPHLALAFKETEIYPLVGDNRANFGVLPAVDTYYGLAAPKLAVVVNGVCYFWSVQGPRSTTGSASQDLSVPLNLDAPEPSDLIASGTLYDGFAVYSAATRQVRFHFGQRCYTLHLRNPTNPRWSYDERGRSLNCGGGLYAAATDSPTSSRLALFYGQAAGNGLLKDNVGFQDDGINYQVRGTSDPLAPAGPDGECSFYTLWLAVTHTMAVTLRVTPIVDGVALTAVDLTLTTKATRTTEVFEVGLKLATGATVLTAPRGTWFQAKVETLVGGVAAVATGDLLLDLSSLEYSIERETRAAS